jgi:hypothetical protein
MDLTINTIDSPDIEISLGLSINRLMELVEIFERVFTEVAPNGRIRQDLMIHEVSKVVQTPAELAWMMYRCGCFDVLTGRVTRKART